MLKRKGEVSYILRIDNTIDTFTLLPAGTTASFEFEIKGNSNIFIGQKREENNLTEAEKKEERRKKNRESAKRSRDKKKVDLF